MNIGDLRHLYGYSLWATEQLLAATNALEEEGWTRDLHSSFPSLRDTFAHLLGAEWLWLHRWQHESPATLPDWTHAPSRARMAGVLTSIHTAREQWLDGLHEDDLDTVVTFRRLNGEPGAQPLGQLMLHVANHSTYHRGQIVTMLRQLGVVPPTTDLYLFNQMRRKATAARR